jgi:hypothetical protein
MDHRETGLEGVDWAHLAQERNWWLSCCEYGNEPSGSIKGR